MKIGIVLGRIPSYSETFFLSKIEGLQKEGCIVVLFTQCKERDFTLCKVKTAFPNYKRNLFAQLFFVSKVLFTMMSHLRPFLKFIQLERTRGLKGLRLFKRIYTNAHILSERMDWLHFGFATMALGKENVAVSIGARMAVSFRGFDMCIYPIKFPGCYDLLWNRVDKVHTISDDLYQLALKQGLSKTIPVQKITPAIDIDLFTSEFKENEESNLLKIITTARLHWKKGLTDTLMALKILKEKGIPFHYTILGGGPAYEKLAFLRHMLDLTEEVTFVGKVSHSRIKELLVENEIYLQYSISEGFCNAALEAQAMGLLCVVSDAEGLPENVLHKKSGWVVPKRSPEKLAEKIHEVYEMSLHEKKTIQSFAQKRVREDFNLEKQREEFLIFYRLEV
jgi:colanic acid/amylovoran biosynthesis glycosyltransferase